MAQYQVKPALDTVDPVWVRIRREAEDVVRREPELATFIYSTILHHDTLEAAIVYRLAERLDHAGLSGELIRQAYMDALRDEPGVVEERPEPVRVAGEMVADRLGPLSGVDANEQHPDAGLQAIT